MMRLLAVTLVGSGLVWHSYGRLAAADDPAGGADEAATAPRAEETLLLNPAAIEVPAPPALPKPRWPAAAITPAEADADFAFQGEYVGETISPALGREVAGLQVLALGDGAFRAVQYRGGLPGSGWNGEDRIELNGSLVGPAVILAVEAPSQYTVTVDGATAVLANAAGQQVGRLYRTERVSPTLGLAPPPGAEILFDGTGAEHFDGGEIVLGDLLLAGGLTKKTYRDFLLHLEFRTPYMPKARGQGRGNSGVYIQERYEVQILDSFGLAGTDNECGALYRFQRPLVNMCLPPLTWQTYDIRFTAARFDDEGNKTRNARITVVHNGVVVQDDLELPNKTGAGKAEGPEPGKIRLQWHSDPVVFRNVWIVERDDDLLAPAYVAAARGRLLRKCGALLSRCCLLGESHRHEGPLRRGRAVLR